MANISKVKVIDCGFSARTTNALTRVWGRDVTLRVVANAGEAYLLKNVRGIGANGLRDIAEAIKHFSDLPPERVALSTNAIKKVVVYQATDGTAFASMEEAARYEARCEFKTWCEEHLGGYVSSDEAGSMADAILDAWLVERR